MWEVKIFVETSLAGPCVKDGWYAAVIEYMTGKGPATTGLVGMERETTYYRSTLYAIVLAMEKLKSGCIVKIYTNCHFIKGIYEQNLIETWRRAEWKKPTGEEVSNKELWQQFFEQVERMGGTGKVEFRFSKFNDYRKIMQKMIADRRKEEEENGRKP